MNATDSTPLTSWLIALMLVCTFTCAANTYAASTAHAQSESAHSNSARIVFDKILTRPFSIQNQNPLVALTGAPRETSALVVGEGDIVVELAYAVASNFEVGNTGAEQILLDGEHERLGGRLLWGVAPGWELGIDVPWLRHSGGYLDDLIIDWHDAFNLPQNGRDITVQDRLAYSYTGPDGSFNLRNNVSGLGDVQLLVAKQLKTTLASSTLVRAHLKLPTGDSDDLFGSGGLDVSLSIHHQRSLGTRWLGGLWAGATYLSESDVLPRQSRNWIGHAGARIAYQLAPWASLKVQWDVHSQVYDQSRLRQLNEVAYLLSFGGTLKLAPSNTLDIVVVENYPHPEISPDVAFQLAWRYQL